MDDTDLLAAGAGIKQTDSSAEEENEIVLSPNTNALLESLRHIKPRATPDELSKLTVSQTVSLLAIAYEKIRNAVEYREDHLVLRAAIERILKRRLALNPGGIGEAENLLRELTWARYFPNESLGDSDIDTVQNIINKYLKIKLNLLDAKKKETQIYLFQFIFDLLTCEIEENLNPDSALKSSIFTYFIFQTLKEKIKVEGLADEKKDAFFLVALDKAYIKSDSPYLRYHLFSTFYQPLSKADERNTDKLVPDLPEIFKKIDSMISNPYVDSLTKFVKKQLPPFLILFSLLVKKRREAAEILKSKKNLWQNVESICSEKYKEIGNRLRNLAIRSLIYIFITKMILALILEYPTSLFIYGEVSKLSIAINTLFPPILMLVIVLFFKLPTEENTKNIFKRIVDIIDLNPIFETHISFLRKKSAPKKEILAFIFTVVYTLTFFFTFYLLNLMLSFLNFNLISKLIFVFFISVISFFAYRLKTVTNEYKLREKESVLTPIFDFFFIPVLAAGKFFSKELGRLNIFIVIFDFIIEAPFKLIIEIFEEWIKFVRARKEEIV
ncbi:MAG: hypothetical protein HYW86_03365 [Candidatus Roizmanbacteria bacterium]|nr:MAG: hypothetical protein HYW86_03365 [Candidatus Roizmanbacteria bacterium]